MKPLTKLEIEKLVEELKPLVGGRLQEVSSSETELGLGIYSKGEMVWLWMDLNSKAPSLLSWPASPPSHRKKTKPLTLFLNANLKNRILASVDLVRQYGRIVRLEFSGTDAEAFVEFRIFPHGQNVLVKANEKQISWLKPKDLEAVESEPKALVAPRSIEQLRYEYLLDKRPKGASQEEKPAKNWEKLVAKKRQALMRIQNDLVEREKLKWREAGVWLKENQSLKVPSDLSSCVDPSLSLSENIERTFEKAKALERKNDEARARIERLSEEIDQLGRVEPGQFVDKVGSPTEDEAPKEKAPKAEARKKILASGLVAWVGKSAQDNLKILRGAQKWDFWLHLKDYPGAHGVIRRNRNQTVSDADLAEVARFVAENSKQSRGQLSKGDRLEVLVAECRFVKPIKGDRIGRVTFTNEKVHLFRY